MSLFQVASDPPTKLGIYRVLSSRAGVRVSSLVLGAMSVGDKWEVFGMRSMNKDQDETSDEFLGEWAEKRGIRDQLVIATKYTLDYKRGDDAVTQKVNYVRNSSKSMHISVEASLKKLRTSTSYAFTVMDSLHNLVAAQKVLYLGISDTPAWVVSQANQYAMDHGKTPFVIYQGKWNIFERSFEREIIPMARSPGLALSPWAVVGQGRLRTDAEEQQRKETGENGRTMFSPNWEGTEVEVKVRRALEKVAAKVGVGSNIRAVAIAYVMHKTPNVFPIIGGRKVEHLKSNIEALDISLSKEQLEYLDGAVPFDPGFPTTMIGDGTSYSFLLSSVVKMAKLPALQPIKL
ncbi:Aldo/keto reductase [Armillaria gallica]|uniref:Aldo/keto reductase n=1 Tax=Armillaria gallica TaxID=47427 RepID=A0A2H3D9A1_ARMGA|nr:Aldo/keto reductase [Armillaria gallica]